eukprot:Sdes_comp9708_c0_seq1m1206
MFHVSPSRMLKTPTLKKVPKKPSPQELGVSMNKTPKSISMKKILYKNANPSPNKLSNSTPKKSPKRKFLDRPKDLFDKKRKLDKFSPLKKVPEIPPGLAKDPNAPKRPKSAYGLFSSEHRNEVKKKWPKLGAQEINQRLNELWKNIPDAKKMDYVRKSKKLRQKYEKDFIAYRQKYPNGAPPVKKLTKREQAEKVFNSKKRDPNAPPPARSAYILWANDLRANLKARNPNLTFAEVQKSIGQRWKSVSDAEKHRYQQLATYDKQRFNKDQAEYFKKYPMMKRLYNEKMKTKQAKMKKKNEKVPKKLKRDPNAPKPPARSGYIMWALLERPKLKEKFPELNFIDVTKRLAEMWQSLTQKKRETYDKEVIRQKKIYETEYKMYMSTLPPEKLQEIAYQKKLLMKYKKKMRRLKKDPNA